MPYYRYVPAYLGKSIPSEPSTHLILGVAGRCFSNIGIGVVWSYNDKENTKLRADIRFLLDPDSKTSLLCAENIQVSTAFTDHYDFYFTSGDRRITIVFDDVRDMIDIHKSGLRFFSYCAN